MSWKILVSAGLLCIIASPAFAAPTLQVTNGGLSGGNQQWLISATPDVATFTANTSLAVELDFTFHGTITSFTMDNTFWNKSPVSNVGNNPFTGTVTGTVTNNVPAFDTQFIAAGSELFATATSKLIGTLVTPGPGGTLDWGGHSVLAAPNTYTTGRIAQNGVNTNSVQGTLTIPSCVQLGDFSCNGTVEGADLTLLLNNWGKPSSPVPVGWIGLPQPTAPAIDGDELTALLSHWAQHTPGAGAGAGAAVPEPASIVLAMVALVGLGLVARRKS